MKRDTVLLLLLVALILAALLKRWLTPHVYSRIEYGSIVEASPPWWRGQLGDTVYWNGRWWGWTESEALGFIGWAPIGGDENL